MTGFDEQDAFEAAAQIPLSQRALGARPVSTDYLNDLNPEQRKGVEALDGPVLMLAGAGTGKTTALMARVAHIHHTKNVATWQILAVTFTNKAAQDMKKRLLEQPYKIPVLEWMGTFHSISTKILRRHAEMVGLKTSFTILDTDDQLRLIKQILDLKEVDVKRWPPRLVASIIEKWKNAALTPTNVPEHEDFELDSGRLYESGDLVSTKPMRYSRRPIESATENRMPVVTVKQIYALYQERLLTLNCVDFGDLLLHCISLLRSNSSVQKKYQDQFRYIVVDEYQDANVAQYLWLRLLVNGDKNICCVGDDDQSIYGWRGAEVGNILRFEADFPGAHVVRLEQNYRSTPHILAAASKIISGNAGRLGKTLWTSETKGDKVRLMGCNDAEEEARRIGEEVESLTGSRRFGDPLDLNDMAILVRAGHQMRAFEDRFLSIGLPYRVIGGPRFYERQEIRDAMAYFRLAISPDDDLAFERVVNLPKRGLGDKAQAEIQKAARFADVSLLEGARLLLAQDGIGGKGAGQLRGFCENMARWHRMVLDPAHHHIALAEMILDESGYTAMWQADKDPDAPGRLENLKELVKALEQFDSLQGFLEHVSLIMENDTEASVDKVSIMTLHAAKGLEFPVVFLPGWEEGLFPSQRSMDESGQKGLEEERRLAYVGITRAEELCTISFASNRRVYGQWQSQLPSRFIDELPPDHVDVQTPPALYGGGYGAASPSFAARVAESDVYNSPGWKRMTDRAHARPMGRPVTIDAVATSAFSVGDRVFHQKFGYGEIMAIEADKLDVEFDHAGSKKVVAAWVTPATDDVPF